MQLHLYNIHFLEKAPTSAIATLFLSLQFSLALNEAGRKSAMNKLTSLIKGDQNQNGHDWVTQRIMGHARNDSSNKITFK